MRLRKSVLATVAVVTVALALLPAVLLYISIREREEAERPWREMVEGARGKVARVSAREYVVERPLTWMESFMAGGYGIIFYTVPPFIGLRAPAHFAMACYEAIHRWGLTNCSDIRMYVENEFPLDARSWREEPDRYYVLLTILFENDCYWLRRFFSREESWYASLVAAPIAVSKYLEEQPGDAELAVVALTVVEVGGRGVERIRVKLYNILDAAEREELKRDLRRHLLEGDRALFIYDGFTMFWYDLFRRMVSEGTPIVFLRLEEVRMRSERSTYDPLLEVMSAVSDRMPPEVMLMSGYRYAALYYAGGRLVRLYSFWCEGSLRSLGVHMDCEEYDPIPPPLP